MQWNKYSQKLNRKCGAITTARFMLYNMEISADLHKENALCIFGINMSPMSRHTPAPSCLASTRPRQDVSCFIVFTNEMKLKVNAQHLNQFIFYLFTAKLINKHRCSERKHFVSYI